MKPDDFEQRLQRQPMRQVPTEWRAEILHAAKPPERSPAAATSLPLWRVIFGRFPVASTAFAGFWIVLIAINVLLCGPTDNSLTAPSIAKNNEPSSIWRLQSAELQQLAAGDQFTPESKPPAPPKARPAPRSDWRRDDEGIGEILRESASNFTA
ncbi:MAG TPA: hypothetical protein VK327_00210 [Candidatus Paceibacterota bacterium]|nr:hypothetical protein [Candidatus Paceibacterota bacterium]